MLVAAGLIDVGWAVPLKYAEGYIRLWWSVASLVLLAALVVLLGRALAVLPLASPTPLGLGSARSGSS